MTLLTLADLSVEYRVGQESVRAVDDVSLELAAGESMGIAGESGCGKTTLGLAIPGLLPANGYVAAGEITLAGRSLTGMSERELNTVRWTDVAFVFQGAMNALNPVQRIERQILEPIATHEPDTTVEEARRRVRELLELVGVSPSRARSYPHEFSGGMRQRVMIAMALACRPSLLIADEPTTALDAISQAQILSLLGVLRQEGSLGLIMISHDIAAIRRTCDRVLVMYAGRLVEAGPTAAVLGARGRPSGAVHPYTQALIRAHPDLDGERVMTQGLPGHPPDLSNPPQGCRFQDRCPLRMDVCGRVEPPLRPVGEGRVAACHLVGQGEA